MSELSFKIFCIEKYADYKSVPSNEAYALFKERGVLEMLGRDEVLRCFGFEYISKDIDEFFDGKAY